MMKSLANWNGEESKLSIIQVEGEDGDGDGGGIVNVDLFSIKFSVTLITTAVAPFHFIKSRSFPICILDGNFFLKRKMLHIVSSALFISLFFLLSFKLKHFTTMKLYFIAFFLLLLLLLLLDKWHWMSKMHTKFYAQRIEISMVVCVSHVSK